MKNSSKNFFLITAILIIFASFLFFIFTKTPKNTILSERNITKTQKSDKNIFTQWFYKIPNSEYFMISSGAPSNLLNTNSVVGILDSEGNFTEKIRENKDIFFGEGITEFDNKIFWTFWKNKKIFIYDKNFAKISDVNILGEGWGLTTNGKNLILSDGSENLTFFDKNLQIIKKISVTENWQKVTKLNELEFIDGKIFANIWLTNDIVIIEPKTGEIIARKNFDFLQELEKSQNPTLQEMNGIAFDEAKNEIILTGKMWENLYFFNKKDFDF